MRLLKKFILALFHSLGYNLYPFKTASMISHEDLDELNRLAEIGRKKLDGLLENSEFYGEFSSEFLETKRLLSKSQLGQDLLALSVFGPNHKGYFVEFGATDGLENSNSFLLESSFGWDGILCEPGRNWHDALKRNRTSVVDTRCVFSKSGLEVEFLEVEVGGLSTISGFGVSDGHDRRNNRSYLVETVSLEDLLVQNRAPNHIDFLSIDTEGSEYEILRDFDFRKFTFGLICVEHNYTDNRLNVFRLLREKGYKRIYPEISAFDDWFVPETQGKQSSR
jgi:FkbM family methyltransferase